MQSISVTMIAVVIIVAVYDFTNGFHDAADMVATAIASRAMRPAVAIGIVSVFTFIAPFTVGLAVADTIGKFVDISTVSALVGGPVVIAALLAAVSYNLATWMLGYPSSSSNSLAGGLVGAGLYAIDSNHINWGLEALQRGELQGVTKVIAGLFLSPMRPTQPCLLEIPEVRQPTLQRRIKKSIAARQSTWLLRSVRQDCDGGLLGCRMYFETVA